MCTVADFRHRIRLLAGKIANMHWDLDKVYERNENDPRLPQMRENLDEELRKHHAEVEHLERVKLEFVTAQSRDQQHAQFIKHKCAKVLQDQDQTIRKNKATPTIPHSHTVPYPTSNDP